MFVCISALEKERQEDEWFKVTLGCVGSSMRERGLHKTYDILKKKIRVDPRVYMGMWY